MENALLAEIRQFLAKTGMSPLYFGREACGNSEVVGRLERGKTVTLRTAETLRAFMAANRKWQKRVRPVKRRHREAAR